MRLNGFQRNEAAAGLSVEIRGIDDPIELIAREVVGRNRDDLDLVHLKHGGLVM
jgi:hypothetical protein